MTIHEFLEPLYRDFKAMEESEIMIHHVSEAYSFGEYVLRCLANSKCNGTEETISAILDKREAPINYAHVDEDSHYFDSLEWLLENVKYIHYIGPFWVRIGIENSIKRGYKIVKPSIKNA